MASIKVHSTRFLLSAPNLKACPDFESLPEFAFVGRSNVGKSSLINSLIHRKDLAQTSNTPGKTRLINLYESTLNTGKVILADLPGYGYAKVSKQEQAKWGQNLEEYLLKRTALTTICLLIDSRLPAQEADDLMLGWLIHHELPFVIILTKTEKLSRYQLEQRTRHLRSDLADYLEDPENLIILPHSAKTHTGRDEIWQILLSE